MTQEAVEREALKDLLLRTSSKYGHSAADSSA
jgi:hypothetical protein